MTPRTSAWPTVAIESDSPASVESISPGSLPPVVASAFTSTPWRRSIRARSSFTHGPLLWGSLANSGERMYTTGQSVISRMRRTEPVAGEVMRSCIDPARLRNATTPVASTSIVPALGTPLIVMCIATRALPARAVRAAKPASATRACGPPDRVEAGGVAGFVAPAWPHAVVSARTRISRRGDRTLST